MSRVPDVGDDPRGFAIAAGLVLISVLTLAAFAAHAAASVQLRVATSHVDHLRKRLAAESAVSHGFAKALGLPPPPGSISSGDEGDVGLGVGWRSDLVTLSHEIHLFRGEAVADNRAGVLRAGRLAWWMSPPKRVAGHRAVIEASDVSGADVSGIDGSFPLDPLPGVPGCPDSLLEVAHGGGLSATSSLPEPPEWGGDEPFRPIRIGWHGPSYLATAADVTVEGTWVSATCRGCWDGLVFSPASLRLEGEGAGVLAVTEDLVLSPGSRWTGLLIVGGDVHMTASSRLVGLVRAGGRASVDPGASAIGSSCAAVRALQGATELLQPKPVTGRSWTGPF